MPQQEWNPGPEWEEVPASTATAGWSPGPGWEEVPAAAPQAAAHSWTDTAESILKEIPKGFGPAIVEGVTSALSRPTVASSARPDVAKIGELPKQQVAHDPTPEEQLQSEAFNIAFDAAKAHREYRQKYDGDEAAHKVPKRTDEDYRDFATRVAEKLGGKPDAELVEKLKPVLDASDLVASETGDPYTTVPKELRPFVLDAAKLWATNQSKDMDVVERTGTMMKAGVHRMVRGMDYYNPFESTEDWRFGKSLSEAVSNPQNFVHPDSNYFVRKGQEFAGGLPQMAAASTGIGGMVAGFSVPTSVDVAEYAKQRGANPVVAEIAGIGAGAAEAVLFSTVAKALKVKGSPEVEGRFAQAWEGTKNYFKEVPQSGALMQTSGLNSEFAKELATRIGGGVSEKTIKQILDENQSNAPDYYGLAAILHLPGAVGEIAGAMTKRGVPHPEQLPETGDVSRGHWKDAGFDPKVGKDQSFRNTFRDTYLRKQEQSNAQVQQEPPPDVQPQPGAPEGGGQVPGVQQAPEGVPPPEEGRQAPEVQDEGQRPDQPTPTGVTTPEPPGEPAPGYTTASDAPAGTPGAPGAGDQTYGIRNAKMAETTGQPEPETTGQVTHEELLAQAMALPADQITATVDKLRADPKLAASPQENARVLRRVAETGNELQEAVKANAPEAVQQEIENRLVELQGISKRTGTIQGQALESRKMEIGNDFSLANQVGTLREAKQAPLTPEERKAVADSTGEIERLTAEAQAAQERARTAELDLAHEKLVREANAKRSETVEQRIDRQYKTATEAGIDPKELRSAAEELAAPEAKEAEAYNEAYKKLVEATGLTPAVISKIESAKYVEKTGIDRGKAPPELSEYKGLDEKAADLARRFSNLGLPQESEGGLQHGEGAQAIVDLIKQGPKKVPQWHDKLDEAAKAVSADMANRGDAYEGPDVPFDLKGEPAEKAPKPVKPSASSKLAEKKAKVAKAWDEFWKAGSDPTALSVGPINVRMIEAAVNLVKAHVELGVTSFTEFMRRARKQWGDEAEKQRDVFTEAWKRVHGEGGIPGREVDAGDPDSIRTLAKKIHREVVELGTTDRDQAVDAVHEELKQYVPGITRDQTSDAISGYGDFRPLSKDAVNTKIREHKSELQLLAKLRAVQKKIPLLKSGPDRQKLTDEARQLQQKLNEDMKRLGVVVTDPDTQLKSPLDTAKTSVKNRITDLQTEIDTREKIVKQRTPLTTDTELEDLRKQRDELQKQHDKMFPREPMSEEQKNAAYEKALKKRLADYEDRVKRGDFATKKITKRTPNEKQADLIRQIDKHKATLQDMAAKARRENRSWREATTDRILKTLRFGLLTFSSTFEHLSGATMWRLVERPIRETVSSAYRMMPGTRNLFKGAPTQGGGDYGSMVTGYARFFTRGLLDGVKTVTKGGTEMSKYPVERTIFKAIGELPQDLRDFINAPDATSKGKMVIRKAGEKYDALMNAPGTVHEAVKAPIARLYFEDTFARSMKWEIEHGADPHDIAMIERSKARAVEAAMRSKLSEDSRWMDAINRFRRIDPKAAADIQAMQAVAQSLTPIIRIPTNYVGQVMEHLTGLVTAYTGLGETGKHGGPGLRKAFREGLDSLTPDEKDLVCRRLVSGTIGGGTVGALMLAGFLGAGHFGGLYQPGRKKRKEGEIKPMGVGELSPHFSKNPAIGAIQAGETFWHTHNQIKAEHGGEAEALSKGAWAVVLGLSDMLPPVQAAETLTRIQRDKTGKVITSELERRVVPGFLQDTESFKKSKKKR